MRQVSPQKWIFKELQDIGNMEFRFAEEQPQDDYAAELAGDNFFLKLILLVQILFIVLQKVEWIIVGKDYNILFYKKIIKLTVRSAYNFLGDVRQRLVLSPG